MNKVINKDREIMMKIVDKKKYTTGKREIYFLGIKIYSYQKKQSKYETIYKKRFSGLTYEEKRFILEEQFKRMAGYALNLDNPQTFNEKIQWLKLNYRNPLMTKCADKVAVRDYVKEKIGEEYLVPIIGVYDKVEDIDWDKLPNKFVAKVNWGSGQNIICKDKSKLDIAEAKSKLLAWMRPCSNHYYNFLEWAYKDIEPKIIIEEYIESASILKDYKFYCFDGKAEFLLVSEGHFTENEDYYSIGDNLNFLPFTKGGQMSGNQLVVPENFELMKKSAELLSRPFCHVRVDFYEDEKGQPFCGELTFYPGNGTSPFSPIEWDYKWGEMLKLPERTDDE